MNELLTVIVPAYNVEKYIGQCLDSLVHQTLMKHKIIIVNDGSKDNTEAVCLKYRDDYPDMIKYIYQDNQGLGAARNTGMTKVDTPWVTFLDSDDWWHIRYVEIFTKWINDTDITPEIIFTLPLVYDNNTARINTWMDKYVYEKVFSISHDCHGLITNVTQNPRLYSLEVSACRKIYASNFLKETNFSFPIGLKWEDVPGHFELLHLANSVAAIPEIGFFYRMNQTGQITNGGEASRLDKIPIFKELLSVQEKYSFNHIERGYVIRQIVCFSRWGVDVTNNEYLHQLLKGLHGIFAGLSTKDISYYLNNISADRNYDEGFIKCLMSSRYDDLFDYRTRWDKICENKRYMLDNIEKKRNIICGGIQCIKEHGTVYTVKLLIKKISNRISE